MSTLQSALYHRPGKHCAVALFDILNGQSRTQAKRQLARLMNCFDVAANRPANLHILVAVNPALIGQDDATRLLPRYGDTHAMPGTQCDALIQISAMTHTDLLYALRICHAILSPIFSCSHEVLGAQIRFDQEPFGFYHANSESHPPVDEVARIKKGALKDGAWLLYQRYVQYLPPFYELSLSEQADIIGAESVAQHELSTKRYPNTAHTRVVKSPEKLPLMIRRGFAYRQQAEEGMVFIAASAELTHFSDTLDKMLNKDAMLAYTQAVEGGIYFVPPSGDWLQAKAGTPDIPNEARFLPLHMKDADNKPPLALQDYTVAQAFVSYLNTLRAYGLFEGPIGNQAFDPEVMTLLQAINDYLAGGTVQSQAKIANPDPTRKAALDALLTESLAGANRFNSVARKYMTLG